MDVRRQKKLYEAVSNKDWDAVKNDLFRHIDEESLRSPISMNGNNIIHLVLQSGSKEPLDEILDRYKSLNLADSFMEAVNARGNTVLHEAAVSGNHEATVLLVSCNKMLIESINDSWETPLFTAAAFGNTEIVKFLASHPGQIVTSEYIKKSQLNGIHRYNRDGASILHAAVQGKHFGTALELLKLDEELAQLKDDDGTNCLFMLAKLPSALKNGHQMGMWSKLLYFCIPVGYGYNDNVDNIETEDGGEESGFKQVLFRICLLFWRFINRVCPVARKTWKEKRSRKFACELARKLVEKDTSWSQDISEHLFAYGPAQNVEEKKHRTPLFAAIRAGNAELVKLILEEHPQAVEQVNHRKQNILYVAAMYRQKEIFDLVKTKEIQMIGLARQIDDEGRTILHTVADTEYHRGGTSSGPAYQLQEELEWFSGVKEIMPSYYIMLPDKEKKTAKDIFKEKHKDQHKEAQQWIKDTSQSCSAVAVLVATVVFAAAFTVPGGTNDKNGLPILLNSPFFLFFTITDIVSLSCSLTAVVMFLSIITSPLELEDFHISLPRRLTFGFALLFMSVATTMLAFTSTIFLIIRLDERRRWTMTLICSAAFFPVSVLALTHFPLFVSFISAWKSLFALPCSLFLRCLKSLRNKFHQYKLSKEKGK